MFVFFKDVFNDRLVSWDFLIEDLNNTKIYNPYCKSTDYYTVFKQIIFSLLIDKEIVLLDSDFTEYELKNLTGFSDFTDFSISLEINKLLNISNPVQLINILNKPPKNWKLTLFTSGTTGVPKKVSHDYKSVTRFVRITDNNKMNIWGFAYNPTHMAGIQVFFQALLNGNSIIRLFGLNTQDIYDEIRNNAITHISATPTFYKLLLPYNGTFPSLVRITSGGEKFNESTFNQLKEVFPNAKVTNVYASTETGTLFASNNEFFTVRPDFESLIKIDNNELFVHYSLLGLTEVNFGDWYNTGDLIEVVSKSPLTFRFVSRKSEMINVGGYKVNPNEVEEAILALSSINDVRVYSKSNSVLGNIICCDIVSSNNQINELAIRTFLQSKIQEFKIPRVIRFVEKISTTRTGKVKRN